MPQTILSIPDEIDVLIKQEMFNYGIKSKNEMILKILEERYKDELVKIYSEKVEDLKSQNSQS